MITKTITYEDFEGNQVTKKFAFHLTKADFIEIQSFLGDLRDELEAARSTANAPRLIEMIRTIVRIAYGERTPDGRFIKFASDGHRLGDDFIVSEAYSELLLDITGKQDSLNEFILGILPVGMGKQLKAEVEAHPEQYPEEVANILK